MNTLILRFHPNWKGPHQGDTEPITLHHLMTHTPGFEDYADSIFRLSADKAPSLE